MSKILTEETATEARRLVTLLDYGVGNLGSLSGSLHRLGYRVRIASEPDAVAGSDAVILPGVGAMPYAIAHLRQSGLDRTVAELMQDGQIPMIGICLGMQLMFSRSEEGDCVGLGLLDGNVRRFAGGSCHVGWNVCASPASTDDDGRWSEAAQYFNHSYYVDADPSCVCSSAEVEGHGRIAAIVRSGPFTGVQFHPEKSQVAGADLLRFLIEGRPSTMPLEASNA